MDEERKRIPNISDVSSMTECTGLMPSPPVDDGEHESYMELYDMEIPAEAEQ